MNDNYLLTSEKAQLLYQKHAKDLPILDFHNHVDMTALAGKKRFANITELWLDVDPYKHRLMRICGVPEKYITGDASPFEKFEKFCQVFPLLAGHPVYDWSRMELKQLFGIEEKICKENASAIYDKMGALLQSDGYTADGIMGRFKVAYQSPVAALLDDLSVFDGQTAAPSLRGDNLLQPTTQFKAELEKAAGTAITDRASYIQAVAVMLDRFVEKNCRFADHALDAGFFETEDAAERTEMLICLAGEYAKRGWTLLLHVGAKRSTSPRLKKLAGPAGGYAGVGSIPADKISDLLGAMEAAGGLPDTVLFPLNMEDQASYAVLQGSFSQDGVSSKVQLGPAWWWCDHKLGMENTLSCIASFGVVSQFIGMTTDSRSLLSFSRHDYFRRILCNWLVQQNELQQWELSDADMGQIIEKICYYNAYDKIYKGRD